MHNTRRAYDADWKDFSGWCEQYGFTPLPAAADVLCLYLAERSGACKVATLQRRLSTINRMHEQAGAPSPTKMEMVRAVWQRIRESRNESSEGKDAIDLDIIGKMVSVQPDNILGIRNRAILLLGFAGGFRRSDLMNLNWEDIAIKEESITVRIPDGRSAPASGFRELTISAGQHPATSAVRAVEAWLEASSIQSGALFRTINRQGLLQETRLSERAVALVVKEAATAAGLDGSRFGAHSLRLGLVMAAAAAGVSPEEIIEQTGHRSTRMIHRYARRSKQEPKNIASQVGL
ncbi:MAG: site-specific integrase [Armatimonadota bacterium]|nr:site-specific integrase [Armatimonadota bacterium]